MIRRLSGVLLLSHCFPRGGELIIGDLIQNLDQRILQVTPPSLESDNASLTLRSFSWSINSLDHAHALIASIALTVENTLVYVAIWEYLGIGRTKQVRQVSKQSICPPMKHLAYTKHLVCQILDSRYPASRHVFLYTQKVLRAAVKAVLEPPVLCGFRSCTNLYFASPNTHECH